MSDAFAPVDSEIARAILDAVKPFQAAPGIDDVQLALIEDPAGEPVICTRCKHTFVEPQLSIRPLWAMDGVLRDVSHKRGERCFIPVRHDFADDQLLDTCR
jgi:hypothetical protein